MRARDNRPFPDPDDDPAIEILYECEAVIMSGDSARGLDYSDDVLRRVRKLIGRPDDNRAKPWWRK